RSHPATAFRRGFPHGGWRSTPTCQARPPSGRPGWNPSSSWAIRQDVGPLERDDDREPFGGQRAMSDLPLLVFQPSPRVARRHATHLQGKPTLVVVQQPIGAFRTLKPALHHPACRRARIGERDRFRTILGDSVAVKHLEQGWILGVPFEVRGILLGSMANTRPNRRVMSRTLKRERPEPRVVRRVSP